MSCDTKGISSLSQTTKYASNHPNSFSYNQNIKANKNKAFVQYYATTYLWEKLYGKIPCKANKQCIYQKMSESYKYAKFCIFCCCDKRCVIMCDNAFSICKACACT